MMREATSADIDAMREQLQSATGRRYWRSLEELAGTPAFTEYVHREFPEHASEWLVNMDRRRFLSLMGASLALAGLTGCRKPADQKIVPYVRPPEAVVPGKKIAYATAMTLDGSAIGVLAQTHMGRPIKIEGNPDHPASLGATDSFAQASLLGLYDPARSQAVTHFGRISGWSEFAANISELRKRHADSRGAGLAFLTERIVSPTYARQMSRLLELLPEARWFEHDPTLSSSAIDASKLAFGRSADAYYRLDRADVIAAFDDDLLASGPAHVRYLREFAARRRVWSGKATDATMSRLYVAESCVSPTGAKAEHRLRALPSRIESLLRSLAAEVGVAGVEAGPKLSDAESKWVKALAKDLKDHRGKSVVAVGKQQSTAAQAIGHAINVSLGNFGTTVVAIEPIVATHGRSLAEFADALNAGKIETLVILDGNPVYNAPVDFPMAELLGKAKLRIHAGLYEDETSAVCHWHVPTTHYLEEWGDTRSFDGTVSIVQPVIAPLYDGRTIPEILAAFSEDPDRSQYEAVRSHWREEWQRSGQSGDFEQRWRKSVHDGLVPDSASKPIDVRLADDWAGKLPAPTLSADGLEIAFRPDPTIFDGQFANNGWLQELPKPITKITWDNAAIVSPATAARLGLKNRLGMHGGEHGETIADVVELKVGDRKVEAGVWIMAGHADDAVTVHLGYGRTSGGPAAIGAGFSAYALRTSKNPWLDHGAKLHKVGRTMILACTQHHQLMEGRDLVRSATLTEYKADPNLFAVQGHGGHAAPAGKPHDDHHDHPPATKSNGEQAPASKENGHGSLPILTMLPPREGAEHKWGMAIDLAPCIGCGACVVACQSENNIPVVGKNQVSRGREMHWLRIDRYFEGEPEAPSAFYFEPVPCMHCETAPCEVVCPVMATSHSPEGLNEMTYNRCVGTRYCSNNCPYKVRRFNFLEFADFTTESLKLMRNPNVTVRSRGIMEKCTYCVQRINGARRTAEIENRPIHDAELATACQQACPAEAIVFGDLNDPNSKVSKMKAQSINYGLLEELGTKPRTTYLAVISNPNPDLQPAKEHSS